MPAATTHVEMAKQVYQRSSYLQTNIQDLQMFYLGSQGPDILFFNKASILPGSTKKYGNLMHVEKIKEVIGYFDEASKNDPILRSYFLGYLCHYSLDSIVHPLVYGVSRYVHLQGGPSESEIHVGAESSIDIYILQNLHRDITTYDVYKYLKISSCNVTKLATFYKNMLSDIFSIQLTQSHLEQAIKDVAFFTKVLRPSKLKYKFFYSLENLLLKGNHFITAMMLNGDKDFTILNKEHKEYTLPWDESETIHASFDELYEQAITKAIRIVENRDDQDFINNFCGTTKHFKGE